jgi:hypothetical protein
MASRNSLTDWGAGAHEATRKRSANMTIFHI